MRRLFATASTAPAPRHCRLAALALAAAALSSCTGPFPTTADGSAGRPIPPATPTGNVEKCIATNLIQNTVVHSDTVIDFRMRNGRVYRNTLPVSCPSLAIEDRFSYRSTVGQLCAVDTITVLYAGGPNLRPGATCGLGTFQEVTLAAQ